MGDLGIIRTVLRAVWVPSPRHQSRRDVSIAAAAIDRMVVAAEKVTSTSRDSAMNDLTEAR